jgi:hypothetical protein
MRRLFAACVRLTTAAAIAILVTAPAQAQDISINFGQGAGVTERVIQLGRNDRWAVARMKRSEIRACFPLRTENPGLRYAPSGLRLLKANQKIPAASNRPAG